MPQVEISLSVTSNGKKSTQYSLDSDIDGKITYSDLLKTLQGTLIRVAEDAFQEEKAKGFDPNPVIVVDGKFNKDPHTVSPFGKIELYARQSLEKVLLFTYEAILTRSRVDTGLYKNSNIVSFNGAIVATNLSELREWISTSPKIQTKDRIRFINIVPYATKLEREGLSFGRSAKKLVKSKDKQLRSGSLVRKPNGAYALAFRAAQTKYKATAFMRFELLPGNYLGINTPVIGPRGKPLRLTYSPRSKYNKGAYLYPTILFSLQATGLLQ